MSPRLRRKQTPAASEQPKAHETPEAAPAGNMSARSSFAASSSSTRPPPIFYLRTKLLPPRPAPSLLARPRLIERLQRNLACSVTLVTANAGSGKTTMVADFVRSHAASSVWYQLDNTDADSSIFLGYIAHGISLKVAGCGLSTLAYLQQSTAELALQPERAVDVLINELLDHIDHQFVIVLDDYHHLGADTPVHRVVDRLLAYLPDNLHIIIISRDVPPLALARLRSQSLLAMIDRDELLFTETETQELFRGIFNLEPTSEQLVEYRERTHGWITALQLVRQVAQRQSSDKTSASQTDLSEVLRQSEPDIFDYFAEEVFAMESPDVQRLLLRMSLLDSVQPDICTHLYVSETSDETIAISCAPVLLELMRRNVFITLASDEKTDARGEEYRLHPLFQNFLQRRLQTEIGASGVRREHKRCADYYLAAQQWEQALNHLLAAEDYDCAAAFIAEHGAAWIAAGALASLAATADVVPDINLASHPRAILHRAEVARLRGELPNAQALFRRAATLLHEQNDCEGEAEALHSLATIARRAGDYAKAFDFLDQAAALTNERSLVRVKCGNTRGACFVALNRWADAEREFRLALQFAEELGDAHYARVIAHNLGMPAVLRGDFDEALRWLRRLLPGTEKIDSPPVPQEATAHLNIARCHLYQGDFATCERHLDFALELCQTFNLLLLRGEIFETYGALYRKQADFARASEFYERSARDYEETNTDAARHELPEEQAMLRLQIGDVAGARAMLEKLLAVRRGFGDEMRVHSVALALGRVQLAEGNHGEAERQLEPARDYFHRHGLYYTEAQTCFALADCAHRAGDEAALLKHLRRALELAARYDYDYWLKREVARAAHLFANAEARKRLPPDVRKLLPEVAATTHNIPSNKSVVASVSPASIVELAPPVDLTINMLGACEIFRERARPFAADAWTTKRARDILCFIASRKHRRAGKEIIQDTFWGEADFEAIEKNFHPTISHIRKALNSNQPLKQNFLLYRDGDYQLNPELSYSIDIENFDQHVAAGEAAQRARQHDNLIVNFEQASELYRGEFMQGSYDNWIDEQRSYYREQYLRLIKTLATHWQKEEQWTRSMQLAHTILREDSFQEDVHCLVMRSHAALGNRLAVKEQYENLRTLLRKELGVEPAPETQKLFRQLLK